MRHLREMEPHTGRGARFFTPFGLETEENGTEIGLDSRQLAEREIRVESSKSRRGSQGRRRGTATHLGREGIEERGSQGVVGQIAADERTNRRRRVPGLSSL